MTRTLKDIAQDLVKQRQEQEQPPVSDVMSRYSAVQSSHGTFSSQPIKWEKPQGSKRRAIAHQLDDLAALVQHVVLTRGGRSDVVRREDNEGGFIARITLPGHGGLNPSGIQEIINQIRSVCLQEFNDCLVDALDIRGIGMGSPVSQFDQLHILTLRVMLRGFNNDAFAQNNLTNSQNKRGEQ